MNIKKIRLERGLDQTEFGNEIGVSKTTVCDWETGKKQLRPSNIKKIIQYCEKYNIKKD